MRPSALLSVLTCLSVAAPVCSLRAQDSKGPQPVHTLDHRKMAGRPLAAFDFSPDGRFLASASLDGRVVLWAVRSGDPVDPALEGGKRYKTSTSIGFGGRIDHVEVIFSPDGKRIAFNGHGQGTIKGKYDVWRAWDLTTGKRPAGSEMQQGSLVFCPDSRALVVTEHGVTGWDLDKGGPSGPSLEFPRGHDAWAPWALSPDCRTLASVDHNELLLWDVGSRSAIGPVLKISEGGDRVLSLAFRPDGKILAIGDEGYNLTIRDVVTGRLIGDATKMPGRLGEYRGIRSLLFSPDGATLAACTLDRWFFNRGGILELWAMDSESRLLSARIEGVVTGEVAFSPDGNTFAYTDGARYEIIVWDVRERRQFSQRLSRGAFHPRFSADGRLIAAATGRWTGVTLWDGWTGRN